MKLHTKIGIGLIAGAVAGVAANSILGPASPTVMWLNEYVAGPLGQIFLRLLFMVVIPLVFASIALGVASLGDLKRVGRIRSEERRVGKECRAQRTATSSKNKKMNSTVERRDTTRSNSLI